MDRPLIEHKLESLRRCLVRIRNKCPATAAALSQDPDAQDIVSLNLTRAVQLCVDIATHMLADTAVAPPQNMAETFTRLAESGVIDADLGAQLRRAVGFRNVAVHRYRDIDWQIVHAIAHTHLEVFTVFARRVHDHAMRST